MVSSLDRVFIVVIVSIVIRILKSAGMSRCFLGFFVTAQVKTDYPQIPQMDADEKTHYPEKSI